MLGAKPRKMGDGLVFFEKTTCIVMFCRGVMGLVLLLFWEFFGVFHGFCSSIDLDAGA